MKKIPYQHKTPIQIVYLWFILCLYSHFLLGLFSSILPISARESSIPVWPPQRPLYEWFERIWYAPFERWDAVRFISIIENGYRINDGSAQFHPLFPLLATPLYKLGLPALQALIYINAASSIASLIAFYQLTTLDMDKHKASLATILFLCSPFAFVFFIPYTDSLFLCLAIGSFYWARQRQWWLAGLLAALATLTRQQGIILVLPLGWELWESCHRNSHCFFNSFFSKEIPGLQEPSSSVQTRFGGWSLFLAPFAYLGWVLFRAYGIGDLSVNFTSVNDFIYTLLISPDAVKVVPIQQFVWPWIAVTRAFEKLWHQPDIDIVTNLVFGGYFLVMLGISWSHLRTSYRLYCAATTFISLSYYTGPLHPYMGLIRHLLLGFPVFIGFVDAVRLPTKRRIMILAAGMVGLSSLLIFYVTETWVP